VAELQEQAHEAPEEQKKTLFVESSFTGVLLNKKQFFVNFVTLVTSW
jgi:hypothetical protein